MIAAHAAEVLFVDLERLVEQSAGEVAQSGAARDADYRGHEERLAVTLEADSKCGCTAPPLRMIKLC
jgi:hypothetical protein